MSSLILNLHHTKGEVPAGAVRVDRRSRFGNPFPMKVSTPEERARVIEAHRTWLWKEIREGRFSLEELAALRGKPLACWCAPRLCHAQTLAAAAEWAFQKLQEKA